MSFEFIYAMGLWLLLWAFEAIALARLEKKDNLDIAQYLKAQSSVKNMLIGISVAGIAIFVIPDYFGFKWNTTGSLVGMVGFLPWVYLVRIPRWKKIRERANQARSEQLGFKGDRVAELKVRRLRNHLSGAALSIPYLILLGAGIYLLYWATSHGLSDPGWGGLFVFVQYLVAICVTLFMHWQMQKLVKDPIDLRSSVPAEFAEKTRQFVKGRMQSFLVAQIAYLISALGIIFILVHGYPGRFWFMATQVPFLASMLWLAYSGAKKMAYLEENRWQEE